MEFEQAEADANAALRLEAPVLNPKTLLRRGTARLGLKRFAAAAADFRQVISLEPGNRCARLPAAGEFTISCTGLKAFWCFLVLCCRHGSSVVATPGSDDSLGACHQPMSCGMTSAVLNRCRQAREELRRLEDMADSDRGSQLDPNSNLSFDITPTETGSSSGDVFT